MATTASILTTIPFEIPPAPSPDLRFASFRHWLSRTERTSEMAEARLLSRLAFFTMTGETAESPEMSKTIAQVRQVDLDGDGTRRINTLIIDQTENDFVIEKGLIEKELCKVSADNIKDTVDNELGFTNNVPKTDLQVQSHTIVTKGTPSPTKKNLVMCHGFGAGLGFWYRNYHTLSQVPGWRIYSIDWLGMGRSSRPKFSVKANNLESVEEAENFFVDSLEEWREIHNIERMTLLGHSLGGYLAAVYALKYPNRVERLVLVSPVGIPVNPHENSTEIKTVGGRTLPGWVVRLWNANITPQTILRWTGPFGPSLVSRYTSRRFAYLEERDRIDLHDYIYQISSAPGSGEYALAKILAPGAYARKPLMHRLSGLKMPTTFLYGEHDWMDYRAAEEACRTMSVPTKVTLIRGAGHHLYLDNPPDFDKAVVEEMLQ